MKTRLWLILGVVLSLAVPMALSAGEDDVQKKVDEIRKQLDELRKKEKELLQAERDLLKSKVEREREAQRKEAQRREKEERERKAQQEAEKKKHYAKVEIRGKLSKVMSLNPNQPTSTWHVSINELSWNLTFDEKNKDLPAAAEKLADRSVVVIGRVVTTKASRPFPTFPGIGNPFPPNPWPNPPNPFPNPMNPFPGWQPYAPYWGEAAPTIMVESITLAKD
jgi:hypothetical protein